MHLYNQPYEMERVSRRWTGMEMALIAMTVGSTAVQMHGAGQQAKLQKQEMEKAEKAMRDIKPPTVPKAPATTEAQVGALTEAEKQKITKGKRRQPTLLTGPRGLLEPAVVQRKTLLG